MKNTHENRDPVNIFSGSTTRILLYHTRLQNMKTITRGIWEFTMRHCTHGKRSVRDRSGGMVVTVTSRKDYQHTPDRVTASRHIPKGATETRIIAALGRCLNDCENSKALFDLREKVFNAGENSALNAEQLCQLTDRLREITGTGDKVLVILADGTDLFEANGFEPCGEHSTCYVDMTEQACRYWLKVFKHIDWVLS